MYRIKHFKSVINSESFHKDLFESRAIVHGLHTCHELIEDFAWFLCAYSLSPGKKKVMDKLDSKKKFGVLSRHLMGVCKKLGVTDLYLSEYHLLKEEEKDYTEDIKRKAWKYNWYGDIRSMETPVEINDVKDSKIRYEAKRSLLNSQLSRKTHEMLDFCFSKYDSRDVKINQILGDE